MTRNQLCLACLVGGVFVPWALLVLGGLISIIPEAGEGLDRFAAYIVAVALLLFALTYLGNRFVLRIKLS
jgi:hypothetical protein